MAPKINQGTIIILDIGQNVSEPEEKNEQSFFEKAKECTTRLIERKIMSQDKSYIGIILLGSKVTKNNMEEQCSGCYRRIELLAELEPPAWKMIQNLPEKATNKKGDWVSALIVAADHFKNGVSGVTIGSKKIILMTNFQSPTAFTSENIEPVLDGFKEEKFEVDVIGLDLNAINNNKNEDIELARQFLTATEGTTASFDFAMSYLLYYKKKTVNPVSWNVDLSIGPNIKIPISAYIRVKDEPLIKKWNKAIRDPVTMKASLTEAIVKKPLHYNTEEQKYVSSDEIIKGFHYGQKIIPFAECHETMLYESGERSLSVYGFTHASNINWQNLNGDGLSYVFGRKHDKKAQYAIRCLVECLISTNLIGIARRVYNKNNAPKMFALIPVTDSEGYYCLSMIGICFKEEIKFMSFPSTNHKKFACTDEQVNAFKDLIKAMDLTKAYDDSYDDSEAFPVAETVSPFAQYMLDSIAFRAMHPNEPLPQPKDEIMTLFKVPPVVEKQSREPLDKIKKLFTLNKVEKVVRRRKQLDADDVPLANTTDNDMDDALYDMPKVDLPSLIKSEDILRIGTLNPVNDFESLKSNGKTLAELTPEMTEAIEHMTYSNLDGDYTKAFDAIALFRTEYLKADPAEYNKWLQNFKIELNIRKMNNILESIGEKKLDVILKSENNLSKFDSVDTDSQIYDFDTMPNTVDLTIRSEVNDMFDEM